MVTTTEAIVPLKYSSGEGEKQYYNINYILNLWLSVANTSVSFIRTFLKLSYYYHNVKYGEVPIYTTEYKLNIKQNGCEAE